MSKYLLKSSRQHAKVKGAATLSDFAVKYVAARDVSPVYAGTLLRRAKALEAFTGATALRKVLTEDNVNAFLATLTHSPHTIKSYRGDLLILWNAAADDDLIHYPQSRRVRRVKCPALIVECYTSAEVAKLVAAAEQFRGAYPNGVVRRQYWAALIRFAWDTGLRRGDCWAFERKRLQDDGTFRVVQHKTGGIVRRKLRDSTLAAIDLIDADQPFEWPLNAWSFGEHFKLLVDVSGVKRGTFKWLRRASGSHVEAETPGAGAKSLGHKHASTFYAHYDAQLGGHVDLPPELPAPPDGEAAAAACKRPEAGRRAIATKMVRIRRAKGGAA